jgi:uncharacterized protein
MTKPIGAICNLDCTYCYYLEKEKMYPPGEQFRMTDTTLETYICKYIASQPGKEITFAWQGGEPTLLGLDFFRRVVELQKKYRGVKRVLNALQTNGTLLDDDWCQFFTDNEFLIGLSIDGPRELHDAYRVDKRRHPTFDRVMRGLDFLQKHGTQYNTLTVVNRKNSEYPLEVYHFLKSIGSTFLQFIPLVERNPTHTAKEMGFDLNLPPLLGQPEEHSPVTEWSVQSEAFGDFLTAIFEEWVRKDVGTTFVQIFDVTLGNHMRMDSSLCVFAETCGNALALEHNGDVFSCDHYVYPEYKLGNVNTESLGEMVASVRQRRFGTDKRDTLPRFCRECDVRHLCHGECPKHRFIKTPYGEPGLNYLCAGYKRFFHHVTPHMETMARLISARRSPDELMGMMAEDDRRRAFAAASRNDPCPCGSGKKYKVCCGGKD